MTENTENTFTRDDAHVSLGWIKAPEEVQKTDDVKVAVQEDELPVDDAVDDSNDDAGEGASDDDVQQPSEDEKPKRKLTPFDRIQESKEKYKARANELEQQNAILQHELQKYKEAMEAKFSPKQEDIADDYEPLDPETTSKQNKKIEQLEEKIFEGSFNNAVRSYAAGYDKETLGSAENAVIEREVSILLDRVSAQTGQYLTFDRLNPQDAALIRQTAEANIIKDMKAVYSNGGNPVEYIMNIAGRLQPNKPVETKEKSGNIDFKELDRARRSAGKPEVNRTSADMVGAGGYTAKDSHLELWGKR